MLSLLRLIVETVVFFSLCALVIVVVVVSVCYHDTRRSGSLLRFDQLVCCCCWLQKAGKQKTRTGRTGILCSAQGVSIAVSIFWSATLRESRYGRRDMRLSESPFALDLLQHRGLRKQVVVGGIGVLVLTRVSNTISLRWWWW